MKNFDKSYWYWIYFLFKKVKIEQNVMEQDRTKQKNTVIFESCIDSKDPESKTKLLGKNHYVDDAN